jgi:RNA polymerase sigma-70 factor (ECF subfamily)
MHNQSLAKIKSFIDELPESLKTAFTYYPRVYASLFSFTKSKEDSEDIAQQTFVKVWQQIKTFRGESAFFYVGL